MSVERPSSAPSERQVSVRLGAIRRFRGKSQAELAAEAGLTRDQLANIESGRTHLRFLAGWNACRALDTDPWYLATGEEPQGPFHELNIEPYRPEVDTMGFLEVCGLYLREDLIVARHATYQAQKSARQQHFHERERIAVEQVGELVRCYLHQIPPSTRDALIKRLTESFEAFLREQEIVRGKNQNQELTNVSESGKHEGVRSPMANLLERLNRATQERGMKSKLARFMGVPLANVSQWLSGEREPGGETTLRLLQWVEQQERSNK